MKTLFIYFLASCYATISFAATDVKGQGRLFLGSTSIKPDNLNTELTAQGLKNMELLNQFGVEITLPVVKYLDAGFRYTKRIASEEENPANSTTNYKAEISGDSFMGVARVPFYGNNFLRADVFGGVGISNTTYKIQTASQNGELTKKTTPTYAAGGSIGFGYKQFFFVIEAGIEGNTAKDFTRTGNVNSNVTEIDMSGSYLTLALMFDGVPVTK
jgi:hypothetical protein